MILYVVLLLLGSTQTDSVFQTSKTFRVVTVNPGVAQTVQPESLGGQRFRSMLPAGRPGQFGQMD